ncbi:hypothetical protein DL96DRAFT_1824349 [Flagelloscypha sp. PMI_526]|nr:hypothetical protein DL96DRAFT_1824349 [Flagelloscypha sp. PMI_526]
MADSRWPLPRVKEKAIQYNSLFFVFAWDIDAALAGLPAVAQPAFLHSLGLESRKFTENAAGQLQEEIAHLGDQALRIKDIISYDTFFDFAVPQEVLHDLEGHIQTIMPAFTEMKEYTTSHGLDLNIVGETLQEALEELAVFLEEESPNPDSTSCEETERMIGAALARFGSLFIGKCVQRGMDKEKITRKWEMVDGAFKKFFMFACKHRWIFWILIVLLLLALFRTICTVLWILSLLGFGPLGPVKGTIAAWLHSLFWGGAVAKGSWFAMLQICCPFAAFSESFTSIWRFGTKHQIQSMWRRLSVPE